MTTEWWLRLGTAAFCLLAAAVTAKVLLTDSGRTRRREGFARATLAPVPDAMAGAVDRFTDGRIIRVVVALVVLGVGVLIPVSLFAMFVLVITGFVLADLPLLASYWRRTTPRADGGRAPAKRGDVVSPLVLPLNIGLAVMVVLACATRLVWPATYDVPGAGLWLLATAVVLRVVLGEMVSRRLVASMAPPERTTSSYVRDALTSQQVRDASQVQFAAVIMPVMSAFWTSGASRQHGVPEEVVLGFLGATVVLALAQGAALGLTNWTLRFRQRRWGPPVPFAPPA